MKQPLVISDIALAAALFTVGIPFFDHGDNSQPYAKVKNKNGYSYSFFFEPSDEANAFVEAWHDDDYLEDSNFSNIKEAFKAREFLLDVIKQGVTLFVIEKGNKFALLSSNATEEQKAATLARL
jgi:hypothetical protein